MRLVSWNVNGLRAVVKKNFTTALQKMAPDILCIQETKAQDGQVREALAETEGYHIYSNSAVRKGYAGTAVLTKIEPRQVFPDMGIADHDQEGRVIALEFDRFFLITVYTPNSGNELQRLEYRQAWDTDFLKYLKKMEKKKPVVTGGDFNVAHKPIDLARPRPNYNKTAGYMQEEIDGMENLLAAGFIDTFRYLYPEQIKYSWWSFRAGARQRNVGWRIDYFLASAALADAIHEADMYNHIMGSDHCPVALELNLENI